MRNEQLPEEEAPLISPEDRAWVERYLGLEPGKKTDEDLVALIEQGI